MADQKVSLLSDTPTDKDVFESHKKVAEAITALISSEETGGMAIAITGSWGSGKSTVIEIIKRKLRQLEKLSENQLKKKARIKTLVFQFDAWTHQDDPPRRAFLESLLDFLLTSVYTVGEGKPLGKQWRDKINKITGKSEISTTTTLKQITPTGALIAILLLITVPLAGTVASKTNLIYGFGLIGLPIIVATIVVLWNWYKQAQSPLMIIGRNSDEDKARVWDQLLRVLLRDTQEIKNAETEKASDATSTDFRIVFNEMMDEVLTRENRRLVIVVDNLDRVDAQKAVSIWATMRIFFELDTQSCAWKSKFWLIAPFDPSALKNLWTSNTSTDDALTLVESFINKTFQVTFRVSPPIFARWRYFFQRNFQAVFKEEAIQNEWQTIYRLYDRFNPHPSFRNIKLFLNKLAVLYLQWENRIPLPFLALYTLIASKLGDDILEVVIGHKASDNLGDIQSPALINAAVLELLPSVKDANGRIEPDGWKKQIAAVHFNVEPDEVVHVLIGNELQQAIISGDSTTINRLAKIPDFWIACERVMDDRLPELLGKPTLLATLRLLHDAEMNHPRGESAAQRVMANLVKRAVQLTDWDFSAVPLVNEIIPETDHEDRDLLKQNVLSAARKVPDDIDEKWMISVYSALTSLSVQRFHFETNTADSFVRVSHLLMRANAPAKWQVSLVDETQNNSIPSAIANYASMLKSGEMRPLVDQVFSMAKVERWEEFRTDCITRIDAGQKEVPIFIEGALSVPVDNLRKQIKILDSLSRPSVTSELLSLAEAPNWMAIAFRCIALFTTSAKAGETYHKILETMVVGGANDLYEAFLSAIRLVNVEAMLFVPGLEEPSTTSIARRAIIDLSKISLTSEAHSSHSAASLRSVPFVARYRKIASILCHAELSEIITALMQSSDLLDILCNSRRLRISRVGMYQILLRTTARKRLLAFLIEAISAARPKYIVGMLQKNIDFQSLFIDLLDAAGPAWLSPELAAALLELNNTDSVITEPLAVKPEMSDSAIMTSSVSSSEGTPS